MRKLLRGGRVLCADRGFLRDCPVLIEDDRIVALGDACDGLVADAVLDVTGLTVLPGLVDVHTHGRAGFDFCGASADEMRLMKREYARRGVTTVFATLASGTATEWNASIANAQTCGFDGIHFEGRYLNPAKRGAHAAHLLGALDADEMKAFLEQVHIPCHVTAALELDADGSFASCILSHGATLGLGHTSATAEEARTALSRGATSFTHLFNAMPPLHHREGGAVSVALTGDAYAELIVDGIHVCPDMVRLAYRCVGGDRLVLITDSMAGTGCADGEYSIAGMPVILKDGRALTIEGALAGSTLELWQAVKNLMTYANIDLPAALACATINPARMVGIDQTVGSIEAGKRADLLLVDDGLRIRDVFWAGTPVQ